MHWNGWAAAHIADYGVPGFPNFGKVLVANHGLPEADRNSGEKITVEISIGVIPEASCDGRIQPLLYAVDVFVPVLNLRQRLPLRLAQTTLGGDMRKRYMLYWDGFLLHSLC